MRRILIVDDPCNITSMRMENVAMKTVCEMRGLMNLEYRVEHPR
jgi:hypothetical protein